jgi:hypothetical protein
MVHLLDCRHGGDQVGTQRVEERTDECSLTGRLNRWRMRSVCGRRKNPYEFDCDQRQEHEQVNSQGPKCDPHRASHFDTWHILVSASNESLHYIPRMNDSEQAVVLIDYRDHVKSIPGEQLRQILAHVIALCGNDR